MNANLSSFLGIGLMPVILRVHGHESDGFYTYIMHVCRMGYACILSRDIAVTDLTWMNPTEMRIVLGRLKRVTERDMVKP